MDGWESWVWTIPVFGGKLEQRWKGYKESCRAVPSYSRKPERSDPLEVHPVPWKCQYSELPRAKATTVEVFEMPVILTAVETPPCLVLPHLCTSWLEDRRVFPVFLCPGGA